jgi:Endonuclease-reverse transcriptase
MSQDTIRVMQANAGKRRVNEEIGLQAEKGNIDIMALQEPPFGNIHGGTLFSHNLTKERTRASIWISSQALKRLRPIIMTNLSGRDTCVVKIHTASRNKGILLVSSYKPAEYYIESDVAGEPRKTVAINDPLAHDPLIRDAIIFGSLKNIPVLLMADCNSWSLRWGSRENSRGKLLADEMDALNMQLANVGIEPTFVTAATTIDITMISGDETS